MSKGGTNTGPTGHHDDPETARGKAPSYQRSRIATAMRRGGVLHRSSPHAGSRPGGVQITDVAQDAPSRARRAQAWAAATGRPIPPQLRARQPLEPSPPMEPNQRVLGYVRGAGRSDTPAQLRRRKAKLGRLAALERRDGAGKVVLKPMGNKARRRVLREGA